MKENEFSFIAAGGQMAAETSIGNWSRGVPRNPGEQERRQLPAWNDTATDFPMNSCVHELFAEQAQRTPSAVAAVSGEEWITYSELEIRANQVANHLRKLGVGPEIIVGLCLDRSLEMIIGLLGILKAGGAYLPLDKNHPQERIAYLLKDAGVCIVLTSAETDSALASHQVQTVRLGLDSAGAIANEAKSAPVNGATSKNLAYVMYTSGSSGKPKGVGIMHYNISRLVLNTNYVQIRPTDVFLQLSPVTFDASTFEIWGALLNGARLALYPSDPMLDVLKLKTLIYNNEVTILWLTAGLFHSIVDGDLSLLSPIKQLLAGGDVISATHVKRVLEGIPGCQVINGYGPTEGTTFSVCYPVPGSSVIESTVPIGRPVSNSSAYVVDSRLKLVTIESATGELYIGGAGIGRGYFHRPDLTAESFVPNPFDVCGTRLYRTGDIVGYTEDGVLQFIGRADFQVKVRGYRIELEEVEAALLQEPGIRQTAVIAAPEGKGDKRLVAYIVGADGSTPDTKKLRENLGKRLPEYMVPSIWVALNALPLTTNGKVDRKALPAAEQRVESAVLQSGIEGAVAEIWASALGVDKVRSDEDFFDLGGTSLALINVVMQMSKRFGIPLDTGIVTRGATVSALTRAVKEKLSDAPNQEDPAVEQAVAEIWASALGVDKVRSDEDFFDLGGTSLALINVVMQMSKRFGIPLDTGIVTRGATVTALAQAVKEKLSDAPKQEDRAVEQAMAGVCA